MCFFLYVASPLTLSEIRSMLPPGLTADLASSSHRATLLLLHPSAKTVAQLLVGACSCDLVRPRLEDSIEDERELRLRYRRDRLSRTEIIQELERHRRGPSPRHRPAGGWAEALAGFAAEHARNAGPTLYLLHFSSRGKEAGWPPTAPSIVSVSEVRQQQDRWLVEDRPVVVKGR